MLGCHGSDQLLNTNGRTMQCRPCAFLINDTGLLDAGTVGSRLTLPEQMKIRHVILSHLHYRPHQGSPDLSRQSSRRIGQLTRCRQHSRRFGWPARSHFQLLGLSGLLSASGCQSARVGLRETAGRPRVDGVRPAHRTDQGQPSCPDGRIPDQRRTNHHLVQCGHVSNRRSLAGRVVHAKLESRVY